MSGILHTYEQGWFKPEKSREAMAPGVREKIGHLYTKSCKNERAKMKESKQNDREITVQDDNITETQT